MAGDIEPRQTVDCPICGKHFTLQQDVAAGEVFDPLTAFGAILCPIGIAHVECADLRYSKDWLRKWQFDAALGLVPPPSINLPVSATTIRTCKMEYIKP